MGIIAIPGMMTRAILDGSDVQQAAFCRVYNSAIEATFGIAGHMRILAVGTITHLVQKVKFRNGDHVDSASERTQLLT